MPAGTYTVVVSYIGYQPLSQPGVVVAAGRTTDHSFGLTAAPETIPMVTVFGDRPPHEVLSESKTVSLSRVDGRTQLTFRLPLTDKADLDIDRRGDDLVLRAGAYSRVYALPDSLAGREVAEAGFKDGTLTISFLQQDAADRKVSPCNRALPDRPGSGTGDIRSQGG